jgi:uncharacterized protein (TIGR02118 family)
MFKRMSILLSRSEDDRASFARKWEHHGTLVSHLPLIRTYLQNHVVEELTPGGMIDADGIVELRFDHPEDMLSAFSHANAVAVKADEPRFLGHGTGYALANDSLPMDSPHGGKLIAVLAIGPGNGLVGRLLRAACSIPGFLASECDFVATVIPRSEMSRPPQQVYTFLHLLFADAQIASAAGRILIESPVADELADASLFRVRTNKVIPAD